MHSAFTQNINQNSIPIIPVITHRLTDWLAQQSKQIKNWAQSTGFKARSGNFCLIPSAEGNVQSVLLGLENTDDFMAFGSLPTRLPAGQYVIHNTKEMNQAALAWGLGSYEFTRYKAGKPRLAQLFLPSDVNVTALENALSAITLSRDLINTPAEDMGPDALENAVHSVAKQYSAKVIVITGDKLLKENYPAIHAVGRASSREPRMIDLRWGKLDAPKVTLVGKGVCFDSGGLNIKTGSAMALMKKDMAGSAMMLGLAKRIMSEQLPVRLRLLIGAVDNAVAGNSYRPGDVVMTRAGKTIEIKNTDAEGRMVLADLLTEACAESPNLLIDFATLTGAARVALGEDFPAMYTSDDQLSQALLKSAEQVADPIWRMPLVQAYREKIKSDIADLSNCADSPWGGSITAALFLQSFVTEGITWAHFDTPAWNFKTKPGRPVGGEVFGVRAVFDVLQKRYI